jgi:hypothetical protein
LVGDGGDRGDPWHTDDTGKVRGKPIRRRRTRRRDSPRGSDDSDALVETGEAAVVSGGVVDTRLPE